jgi:TetR/AcrR family transcriptional regulator
MAGRSQPAKRRGDDATAAAKPRATTRVGEANVARILDCALALFARYGLRGARIEEVAAAAGMSKTNLLYYFPTKDALYTAVLARTLDMWLEPLRALDADAGPREALSLYIARKLDYSRSHPEASRLYAMEMLQGAPHLKSVLATDLAATVAATDAIIASWIARGLMRPLKPLHLIFAIWASTQHYADFGAQIEALAGRGIADDAFFAEAREAVTALILHGALTEPAQT